MQTFDTIHTSFPRSLTSYFNDILTLSLNHMRTLFPTFSQYYLSSTESVPSSSEDGNIDLQQLICPILDFVSAVSRGGKAKEWFQKENMDALISMVFSYSQMTDEDVSLVGFL
jgi:hypothetical protein